MLHFVPTREDREALKQAVGKYSREPIKSRLLAHLETEGAEYNSGGEERHESVCG